MEHHVYFWLNEEGQEKKAAFEAGLEKLLKTPHIGSGSWGKPAATPVRPVTDNSFDYALSLKFESIEEHNAYQVHAEHDVFVEAFKDIWAKALVMDVE